MSLVMAELSLTIDTFDVGVRCFSLSSCGSFLVLVNDNAELLVHRLRREKDIYVAYDNIYRDSGVVPKQIVLDHVKMGCQLSWHPSQSLVAIPSSHGSVALLTAVDIQGGSWKETSLVGVPPLSPGDSPLNLVAFSPCGHLLLSADIAGRIIVWDMEMKDPIHAVVSSPSTPFVSLAWGGSGGRSVLAVNETHFCWFVHDQSHDKSPSSSAVSNVATIPTATSTSHLAHTVAPSLTPAPASPIAFTIDDAARGKHSMSVSSPVTLPGRTKDQQPVKVANRKSNTVDGIEHTVVGNMSRGPDVDDDYDRDGARSDSDGILDDVEDGEESETFATQYSASIVQKCIRYFDEITRQVPFQPSSTSRDEKGRMYLVWNAVGSIVSREDGMTNRIEIKFTNIDGNNKPEAFPDNYGFTKASLSYEGAFFATDAEEAESDVVSHRGSTIYYHAFPNQRHLGDANESFTSTLPHGEGAVAVAVGSGWAAVVTSQQYLRIFSSTGLQLLVSHLKGPIISLVGCGEKLAIFYYGSEHNSQIQVEVLTIHSDGSMKQIVETNVPHPKSASIFWVGFENETGTLFMMNSLGVLSAIMLVAGWRWVPVLDSSLKKGADQCFWPIAVKTDRLCYVLLNGESQPAIHPQPVIATKLFRIPICESKEGKDRGEAQNERSRSMLWHSLKSFNFTEQLRILESQRIYHSHLDPETFTAAAADTDKSILVLFQEACKSQKIAVAVDLSRRLVTEKAIWSGITIANYFGRTQLASLLQALLERRANESSLRIRPHEGNEAYDDDEFQNAGTGILNQEVPHDTEKIGESLGLSKKLSSKSIFDTPAAKKSGKENGDETDREAESETKLSKAANPFARSCPLSPPLKRKSIFENVKDLKASPSPKKAVLSVLFIYFTLIC